MLFKFITQLLAFMIRILVYSRIYTGTCSMAQEIPAEFLKRTSSKLPMLKTGKVAVSQQGRVQMGLCLYARRMELNEDCSSGFLQQGCQSFMFYYKSQFLCFFASFFVFLLANKWVNYCIISELEIFNRTLSYV